MTSKQQSELEDKIKLAVIEATKGNFRQVEQLANEVLIELDKPSHFLEAIDSVEGSLRAVEVLRANAMLALADSAWKSGEYHIALEYGQKALTIVENFDVQEVRLHVYNLLGIVNRNLGNYHIALEYYTQALHKEEEAGEKSGVARLMANIGIVYSNIGSYDRALEYYAKALALHDELGEKSRSASCLGNIGAVYSGMGSYDSALEYFTKALAAYEALGEKLMTAIAIGNIGVVYFYLMKYDKALEYYTKALSAHELSGNKSNAAAVIEYLGAVYFELGTYDKALEFYKKALAAYEGLGNKSSVAVVSGNIAQVYSTQNFEGYDAAKAEEHLVTSVALSTELGIKQNLYKVLGSLADLYGNTERWKEAFTYHKRYHEVEKEVQNEEATEQAQNMEHRRKIEEAERDRQVKLARFQEQEKILHNILPSQIADRMIEGEKTIADSHEHVSVFFSDIVGFTKLSQRISAEELVVMLNGIFSQFDQLARKHGLEKIKTIGDAYMAVCGAPIHVDNHAERAALFALEVAELMNNYQTNTGDKVMIRIGLHSGGVVAGIIGENKFAYDMWGDAVNTASRMESHGEPGKIHVSEEFKQAFMLGSGQNGQSPTSPMSPLFTNRGEIDIKGKGIMKTYFLQKATL
ncbi:MAG: tetratricopeptide repeat protein [Ignavibacteria bacterium]|nr:tetratricopeptide repeat protein [Ignavibacteria bacterium]